MGNTPNSQNKSSFSSIGNHKMANRVAYQNIILVKTKPWDAEKRKEQFPSEEVTDDKMTFETTFIDVEITQPTLTEKECTEKDIFPMPYVNLDNNTQQEYHTLKNSNGQITVSVEPRIPNRHAIFTFHVKRKGTQTWDRYDIKKKKGETAVCVETDQLDIDTVFITSKLEVQTIQVTRAGCEKILDPDDENMKIEFQPKSVRKTMEVTIEVTSLDDIVKETKLEQLFGKDHGILGMSDMVNVTHEGNFLLPVKLTVPIQPLQPTPDDEQLSSLVFYVEDNTIHELEQATVEQIADNLFTISTNHFCPVVCVRSRRTVRRVQAENAVRYVYDIDDPRCNILLFSKKVGEFLYLRSEIVSQDDRQKMEHERTTEMGMNSLSTCTSPTIRLKNMDRVRVSLANHMAIKFPSGIPLTGRFIVYDRHNCDNSLSFHVELNKELGAGSMATLEYDLDSGRNRRSLHKATFSVLNEMKKSKNIFSSRNSSRESFVPSTGIQTNIYRRQVSDFSGYSTSAGSEYVCNDVSPNTFDVKVGKTANINFPDTKQDLVPSQLPVKSSQTRQAENPKHVNKPQVLPLEVKQEKNISKPEIPPGNTHSHSEVFSEKSFTLLARQIPDHEYHSFATLLGISVVSADRLEHSLPDARDRNQLKLRLLLLWLQNESTNPSQRLKTLMGALQGIEQKGLAEKVEEAFNNNRPFRP